VWRRYGADGKLAGDLLSVEGHHQAGEPLIHQVMKDGRRLAPSPSLDDIRRHAGRELERLPDNLRRLIPGATLTVEIADDLVALAADADRRRTQTPDAATKPTKLTNS
jgi:nicotinate phosphoribosyltransferase